MRDVIIAASELFLCVAQSYCIERGRNRDDCFALRFITSRLLLPPPPPPHFSVYFQVCTVADDAGCDTTNPLLEDFFACIADEEFDCPDFVSCAAVADPSATLDPVGDTPAPVMTTAPTDMTEALTTTMAPSSVEGAEDAEDPEDPEETREANEDSGVSRTVAAAATRTAMALACGLALSYAV